MKKFIYSHYFLMIAMLAGVATGLSQLAILTTITQAITSLFLNYLSLIAAPILLLAILSTLMGVRFDQIKRLGRQVFLYTLLTTLLAALVALGCFLVFNPVSHTATASSGLIETQGSYLHFFVDIVPSNMFKAMLENKVISITFLGFLFGIASHFIEPEARAVLEKGVSALFKLFLKVARVIPLVMPIAIWAFTAQLTQDLLSSQSDTQGLWRYLGAVVSANLIQGVIILPILLKIKGISPWQLFKKAKRALLVAFFTKSSNATLPISLEVAQEEIGIHPRVARFAMPLCTVINMNGCAAFILTTVLFVAGVNGHLFSAVDLGFWIVLSTVAAIGNAGVPMGCFFLSSAFLVSMDVPLSTMGLILPFYALIDMEETALNVWSDIAVTTIVDAECKQSAQPLENV